MKTEVNIRNFSKEMSYMLVNNVIVGIESLQETNLLRILSLMSLLITTPSIFVYFFVMYAS